MPKTHKDILTIEAEESAKTTFWSNVVKTDSCWLFKPQTYKGKYSFFVCKKMQTTGHRAALLWETKEPKPDEFACHRCRNKNCVRPSHLYWGTQEDNARDKVKDGTKLEGSRHPCAVLNEELVKNIWMELRKNPRNLKAVSEKLKVSHKLVWLIKNKDVWTHVTDLLLPMTTIGDASKYEKITRQQRVAFTEKEIDTICQMIDNGEMLKFVAKHANASPNAIRNVFCRKRGHFPVFCTSKKDAGLPTTPKPLPGKWKRKRS